MKKKPLVSICCITYNQENYIRETLESFLMQKTDFDFEIIIHDDASTDNTVNIIKEYEMKYPDIVKPIYQKENQYSKKVKIFPIVFSHASGKYIAVCEGDDYWCDEYKLQKQFDFIEKHKECSLITTGAKLLDDSTKKFKLKKQPYKGSRFYTTDEVIMWDGDLFATNSMFFKSELLKTFPKFYYLISVGDYPLTIHLALLGKVYYMDDYTSVYRINAQGSWTSNMKKGNYIEKKQNLLNEMSQMFNEINTITDNKYKESTEYVILKRKLELLYLSKKYEQINSKEFKLLYKKGTLKSKIKFLIKIKFKYLFVLLKRRG